MDTTIKVDGKDVTEKFEKVVLNALAVTLKTANPASQQWYTIATDLPASLLAVLTDKKNAGKTLEVTIAPEKDDKGKVTEAGKTARLTFAQFVAKLEVSKKISDLLSKDTAWKYEIVTVGKVDGTSTKGSTKDYTTLEL